MSSKAVYDKRVGSGKHQAVQDMVYDCVMMNPGSSARELAFYLSSEGQNIFKETVSGTLTTLFQKGLIGKNLEKRKCTISKEMVSTYEIPTPSKQLEMYEGPKEKPVKLDSEESARGEQFIKFMLNNTKENKIKILEHMLMYLKLGKDLNWNDVSDKIDMYNYMNKKGE